MQDSASFWTEVGRVNNRLLEPGKNSGKGRYRVLLELLPSGEENAVSMRMLARWLETSPRNVRKLVEGARLEGNIIASTDAGYFVPETEDELRHYVAIVRSRARTAYATIREAQRLLQEVGR